MEPESYVPHSQQAATCPYLNPARSSYASPSHVLQINFNIIIVSMPRSSKWSPSIRSTHQNTVSLPYPIQATRSDSFIHRDSNTRIIFYDQYRSQSSSLCSLLHSPVTSSFVRPNILLNTLILQSFLGVKDQVSHPYKTCKIIVLYILIFIFLDSKIGDKRFGTQ